MFALPLRSVVCEMWLAAHLLANFFSDADERLIISFV